jgi:hypothetical protein
MKDNENTLFVRVLKAKEALKTIGVKMPRYYFSLKYPEYKTDDGDVQKDNHELNNLWYGKVMNEDFTIKLEAFVEYKKVNI